MSFSRKSWRSSGKLRRIGNRRLEDRASRYSSDVRLSYLEIVMNIVVIDSQGGGIGRQVVSSIKAELPEQHVIAIGTNAQATAAMLKAGADQGASGENPVIVACRIADIIIGPIGIVIADSMMGEVSPAMALAVCQSKARRILIPVNHCDNIVVGVGDLSLTRLIREVIDRIRELTT